MRIMKVWLTAAIACFIVTMGWYISQGTVTAIATQSLPSPTGQVLSLLSLVEFMNIIWGPLFDILIILWAFMSSQEFDPVSRYM